MPRTGHALKCGREAMHRNQRPASVSFTSVELSLDPGLVIRLENLSNPYVLLGLAQTDVFRAQGLVR